MYSDITVLYYCRFSLVRHSFFGFLKFGMMVLSHWLNSTAQLLINYSTVKPVYNSHSKIDKTKVLLTNELVHEISNNVVCATSKASDQPAHLDQSLCLSLEYPMRVKLLTEHNLRFLSLKGGYTGLSESTLVKMPHCW